MKTRKLLAMLLTLAILVAALAVPASANPSPTEVGSTGVYLCFGSPAKPDTFPESMMSLSTPSGGVYSVLCGSNNYYPSELSIYAYDTDDENNTVSFVTEDEDAVWFEKYDINGNATKLDTINYTVNVNYNTEDEEYQNSNLFAVKIADAGYVTVKKGNNTAFRLYFSAPTSTGTNPGKNPVKINGYLPVGQFARGTGWGSAYENGNQYGSGTTLGDAYKFTQGLNSTGVSIGMLGGYVQFELTDANMIKNDANNPYGVDFIVYGNAFNGNPEAAMVMVSEDGEEWFNLAGSRHYQAGTTKSMNASFIKIESQNTTITDENNNSYTFANKGIYFSSDYAPADYTSADAANHAIVTATWSGIPNYNANTHAYTYANPGVAFWPEFGDTSDYTVQEGYNRVWNDGTVDATASGAADDATGKVYWNRLGDAEVISYCGVSRVLDDAEAGLSGANATDYYRFGYADVRPNGSSIGTPVNPYATAPSALAGGDGFDLSWAVDEDGIPVSVNNVHYVRVYSAVLYNAGIFGETSAEVCGLYVVRGGGTTTLTNDLYVADYATEEDEVETTNGGYQHVNAGHYILYSDADYVYVNGEIVDGENGYDFYVNSGSMVQIITQYGNQSPYLTVLYC